MGTVTSRSYRGTWHYRIIEWLGRNKERMMVMDVEPRLCSFLLWGGNLEMIGEWCDNEVSGTEGDAAEFCSVHVNALDPLYDPDEYLSHGYED